MKYEEIKLEYSPEWKGPVKDRSLTDRPFLAIFAVFIICWITIGCYALVAGNPQRLLAPEDLKSDESALDTAISSRTMILGLIAASAAVCLLCVFLLKWITFPLVALSITVWFSISGYIAYYSCRLYVVNNESVWLTCSILFGLKAAIILLIVLCKYKKIRLACHLIKEASKAVTAMKSSVFFPLLPWLLQLAFLMFQLVVGLYLSSIDSLGTWPLRLLCAINVVGFIWLHSFITAFAEMVLAGTFATWYWTFKKSDVPFFTVATCIWRTTRYHLGSVALGSLLITICLSIRRVLEFFRWSKASDLCASLTRFVSCCASNMIKCFEEFVMFMNRNAYIVTAVYGKGLRSSASDAMSLLLRNTHHVTVLNHAVSWVLCLVKMSIAALMSTLTWSIYVTTKNGAGNWWVPVAFVFIGAYTVSHAFFTAYEVAVDTIFLCFLEDCERNDGSESRPYYMSRQLRKVLHKGTKTGNIPNAYLPLQHKQSGSHMSRYTEILLVASVNDLEGFIVDLFPIYGLQSSRPTGG